MVKVKEYLLHTFVADFLNENSVVVDLGANKGGFSESIAAQYECRVFAVEPVPEVFQKIKAGELIEKFNYCIAGQSGIRKLHISPATCAALYKTGDTSQEIEVRCVSLDDFISSNGIEHIDLLKVDIEEAEIELFESIKEETLKKIDQITVEFHDFLWPKLKERVEVIKEKLVKGYYCIPFSITNDGDVLFVKKELISFFNYLYFRYIVRYLMGFKRRFHRLFR